MIPGNMPAGSGVRPRFQNSRVPASQTTSSCHLLLATLKLCFANYRRRRLAPKLQAQSGHQVFGVLDVGWAVTPTSVPPRKAMFALLAHSSIEVAGIRLGPRPASSYSRMSSRHPRSWCAASKKAQLSERCMALRHASSVDSESCTCSVLRMSSMPLDCSKVQL